VGRGERKNGAFREKGEKTATARMGGVNGYGEKAKGQKKKTGEEKKDWEVSVRT